MYDYAIDVSHGYNYSPLVLMFNVGFPLAVLSLRGGISVSL